MIVKVEDLAVASPPSPYKLRLHEIDSLWDCAQLDPWKALSAAYNYGFIRGQRAEKNSQRRRRTRKEAKR